MEEGSSQHTNVSENIELFTIYNPDGTNSQSNNAYSGASNTDDIFIEDIDFSLKSSNRNTILTTQSSNSFSFSANSPSFIAKAAQTKERKASVQQEKHSAPHLKNEGWKIFFYMCCIMWGLNNGFFVFWLIFCRHISLITTAGTKHSLYVLVGLFYVNAMFWFVVPVLGTFAALKYFVCNR
ncbi:hypothetical protein ENBRE01_1929 [Enteropsectra breve]|nr:hypothetical protein ENBRE01_1929 [Enteropsectra breve]